MTCVLTAVRQEVNNSEISVLVHELELAINRALYEAGYLCFIVFMKLR